MSLDIAQQIADEFGGQFVGGVVIVFEDGKNVEAARCVEGTWVVDPVFTERLNGNSKATRGRAAKNLNDTGKAAPAVAPNIAETSN